MTIASVNMPGQGLPPIGYSGSGVGAPATIVNITSATGAGSTGVPASGALPARLRQLSAYANAGSVIVAAGDSVSSFGAIHTAANGEPDSIYDDMLDAGGAGNSAGVAGSQSIKLDFQPIHWETQIRSSAIAQGEWRFYAGIFAQGPVALPNNDALGAVQAIGFRFHKTIQPNFVFLVNDGATQTEVVTTIPLVEGPGAQNTYRLALDITATVITWTVQNLSTGATQTGTAAVPGAYSKTVRHSPFAANLCDIAGGAKEVLFAKMEVSYR